MLQVLKNLKGLDVVTEEDVALTTGLRSGESLGKVSDILIDDLSLTVRYFVVQTGGWLHGRNVLIAPASTDFPDIEQGHLVCHLSREQIETSPPLDTHPPLSRQYETLLHDHYAWVPYWGMPVSPTYGLYGTPPLASPRTEWRILSHEEQVRVERQMSGDPHLQSVRELHGYAMHAVDGDIGELVDLLVATRTWTIKYLIVNAGHWFASRKVVIDAAWIRHIDWAGRKISVTLNREDIRLAPVFDSEAVGTNLENDLSMYYRHLMQEWRDRMPQSRKRRSTRERPLEQQS